MSNVDKFFCMSDAHKTFTPMPMPRFQSLCSSYVYSTVGIKVWHRCQACWWAYPSKNCLGLKRPGAWRNEYLGKNPFA